MVYKSDIYSFLSKCEKKATDFVKTKFMNKLGQLKSDNRFFFILEDYKAYKASVELIEKKMKIYQVDESYDGKGFKLRDIDFPEIRVYEKYWGDLKIIGAEAMIVAYITKHIESYPDCEWVLTYEDDRDNIKSEYHKLRMIIESTKSNKKCLELLKQLGYDISSLIKEAEEEDKVELDKSKLLVCKEGNKE